MFFIKPQLIIEVAARGIKVDWNPALKYSKGKYEILKDKLISGVLRIPSFIRVREEKGINLSDLRLTQIPEWKDKEQKLLKEKEKEDAKK